METVLNMQITTSLIVIIMAKITMGLLLLVSVVMLRQIILMDRVVKLPVGGSIKTLTWSFFALVALLTVIVVLV